MRLITLLPVILCWSVADAAPVTFSDQTAEAGVDFVHAQSLDHRSGPMAAGGAVGDFNGDGLPDLFVLGGGDRRDALFINNGDGTFDDQAEAWGVDEPHRGVGATVGDYDRDGDDDLFVTSFGPMSEIDGAGRHRLYRNDGDRFTNVADAAGVAFSSAAHPDGYGSAFGDYDRDGDLDLYVSAWHNVQARGSRLFRNNGDGTFDDVSEQSGIVEGGTHAFGAIWADMNGDRYPELLVAGDFGTNRYYRNVGGKQLVEQDPGTGLAVETVPRNWSIGKAHNGMGTAVGDFDRDGMLDWFVTAIWPTFSYAADFWGNGLYLNRGDHVFVEGAEAGGVHDGGWGWGTSALDFDNNGTTDIAMTNGWRRVDPITGESFINERGYLWLNRGDASFDEVGVEAGFDHYGQGRALLDLDYDRDGDMDLVVLSNDEALRFYRNDLIDGDVPADAHWLQVRLVTHESRGLAPHGLGATITVEAGGQVQTHQVTSGGTYLGQGERVAHFGLGTATAIDRLEVDWGNGKKTRLRKIQADQYLVVRGPCLPQLTGPIGPVRPIRPSDCSSSGQEPRRGGGGKNRR